MKTMPNKLNGLPVITRLQAAELGFQSITIGIHAVTEKPILASVAQHRNPERAAFMSIGVDLYELVIKREDISHLADSDD